LYISHIIQLIPQKLSAEPRNSASAEALAVARNQKTNEGIEGEDPAAAGIERFYSLKGPREENNVREFFLCGQRVSACSGSRFGFIEDLHLFVCIHLYRLTSPGAVPALSWCGEVSLGGKHIIIESI